MYFHASFVRDSIVISFLCIELVSFADNAIIIGVPTPSIFKDVLDYLHKKPEYKKDRSRRTKNSTGGN